MDDMKKLERHKKPFQNVGKRNLKMPDEFGGGLSTSPRELVKPLKPEKQGKAAASAKMAKQDDFDKSEKERKRLERKYGVG